jgi:hypothetical protein
LSKILAVLPFALTMNLGPQIITAIALITAVNPVKKSLVYLAAVLTAATSVTLIAFFVFGTFKTRQPAGGKTTTGHVLDYVIVAILVLLAIRVFLKRKKIEKPKLLVKIQGAGYKQVFITGLLLYSFFPTDLAATLTVAAYLASHQLHYYSVLPFLALTVLIAALPILSYLTFEKRAKAAMPRVEEWLDSHAWIVNEVVILFFICMILFT